MMVSLGLGMEYEVIIAGIEPKILRISPNLRETALEELDAKTIALVKTSTLTKT